jgi:uncharacterized protein
MKTFLKANWENIIMANYKVPEEVLFPFLPKGVSLDLYEGNAYVSLVGFMFKNTRLFNIPIPFLGTFEEVNLRFYVKREVNGIIQRGVVFINETVPYKAVAYMANRLYKEHYTAVKTKHTWKINTTSKEIKYEWFINNKWNSIEVQATVAGTEMKKDSFEQFIFEHYYGYTKVNENETIEYKINHPSWKVNEVHNYTINCKFEEMYGETFGFLNHTKPTAVFIAEGSAIAVDWKRNRLVL